MRDGGRVSFVGIGSGDPRHLTYAAGEVLSSADVVFAPAGLPAAFRSLGGPRSRWLDQDADAFVAGLSRDTSAVWLCWGSVAESTTASKLIADQREAMNWEVLEGPSLVAVARSTVGIRGESPINRIGSPIGATGSAEHRQIGRDSRSVAFVQVVERAEFPAFQRMAPDAKAILVADAGLATQRWEEGDLGRLDAPVGHGPLVCFVGSEFEVDPSLGWFERRPLFGRRIVVTRPRHQSADLSNSLRIFGAEVLELPTIRIDDPDDAAPLHAAAAKVGGYDWVIFTSANGVERFWAALERNGLDSRALGGVKVCAIGPATGAAVENHGAGVDLLPAEYVAESVIEAMRETVQLRGAKILLPRADIARDILPDTLAELGAEVTEVAAYRTVADEEGVAGLRQVVADGGMDLVTFTSSSTVRNFADLVSRDIGEVGVASIGPITSGTARDLGWKIRVEAEEHTADGLVEAIVRHYQGL